MRSSKILSSVYVNSINCIVYCGSGSDGGLARLPRLLTRPEDYLTEISLHMHQYTLPTVLLHKKITVLLHHLHKKMF